MSPSWNSSTLAVLDPDVVLRVDATAGTSIVNYAEWRGEAEHRQAIEGGNIAGIGQTPSQAWDRVLALPHTTPLGFEYYRPDGLSLTRAANDVPARPMLGLAEATQEAVDAVARFVAELQGGVDDRDADVYNRHFAGDVVWGSPFGAVVHGYEQLHAIHVRLQQQGRGGPSSRYEIERVVAPGPDVAVALVKRVALDAEGRPVEATFDVTAAFSEMALYVLVRREGDWWLAAGQNTPVRPGPLPAPA